MCHLSWTRRDSPEDGAEGANIAPDSVRESTISVPVYLHSGRSELILAVDLAIPSETSAAVWRQRGIALLAWGPVV